MDPLGSLTSRVPAAPPTGRPQSSTRTRLLLGILCAAGCARAAAPADLILKGGRVYVRPVSIQAEPDDAPKTLWLVGGTAVACRAGRIVYVGDDKGSERFRGPQSRVVELHGGVVVPGAGKGMAGGASRTTPVLDPGAEAEMTVFSEDPFAPGHVGEPFPPPPVLYRVTKGELQLVLMDPEP